jgi:hypothetical protein
MIAATEYGVVNISAITEEEKMITLLKKTLLPFVAITWMCAVALPAAAATITGLFDTGVLDDGTTAASGSTDLHYTLFSSPDPNFPGPNAIVADPIASGFWLENSATSRWIGPAENQGYPDGPADYAVGEYTYRLTFDLTGLDPATASITGGWAADNSGVNILLNGASTGAPSTPGFFALEAFSITSGFIAGINTLDFIVLQTSGAVPNPTALRVEGLAGTAELAAVPVPAAGWLLATALIGTARWRQRRPPQA